MNVKIFYMNNNNKFSSKKTLKPAKGLFLASAIVFSGVLANNLNFNEAVQLSNSDNAMALAEQLEVCDLISQDNNFVRFEALKNKPINVVVDEKSYSIITETNIKAIKDSIENYNKLFSYINPEYSFKYISAQKFNKNNTDPIIYITSNLSINTKNGQARATTTKPQGKQSKYGNGLVDSNATIVINSVAMSELSQSQQQAVIMHEIGHALGINEHSNDLHSIMNAYSTNRAIASMHFSKDIMHGLVSLYYNANTNPHTFSDIQNYIENIDKTRKNEINLNFNLQDDYTKYLNAFLSEKNLTLNPSQSMLGKTFTFTNIYNQTTTIVFNTDNTYTLTIERPTQKITCNGNFVVKDFVLVLSGENYSTNNGNLCKIQDIIYVSALSDGSIIYGCESQNCTLKTQLQQLQNEDTLEL